MTTAFLTHRQTLADMREQVYFLIDEEPSGLFKPDAVDRMINRGITNVAEVVARSYITTDTTVLPGYTDYSPIDPWLSFSGGIQVARVTLTIGTTTTTLEALSAEPDDVTATGTPTGYLLSGRTLNIYPVPDAVGSISVTYKAEVVPLLTDTDMPPLSNEACEVATLYAVWMLKLKDDEAGVADRWRDEYQQRLRALGSPKPGVYKPVAG